MNNPASREQLMRTLLLTGEYERMPDSLPRPDGIRFPRGILLAIVLCLPFWISVWWVASCRF